MVEAMCILLFLKIKLKRKFLFKQIFKNIIMHHKWRNFPALLHHIKTVQFNKGNTKKGKASESKPYLKAFSVQMKQLELQLLATRKSTNFFTLDMDGNHSIKFGLAKNNITTRTF